MKTSTVWTRLGGVMAIAAGLALAGAASAQKPEEKVLRLFCWSESVPQDVVKAFTKETGIKVSVENYASNEEMLAKLASGGGYDLIQPSEYVVEALAKAGRLEPLDHSKLGNLKNLDPAFLDMPFDPKNKYSVPWMAGTVGIAVNTARIKEPITGFEDVFQARHKGRIVVLDDGREMVSWALATLKIDANDITKATLEKARAVVSKWVPLIKVYDSDSPKTALLNGDVDLGVVWSGEGAALLKEDKKFAWVMPKEGTHLFVDSLAIPKGTKHPGNAHLFIDFILRPDISAKVSEEFPYLNPNLAARKLLTQAQLGNAASFPSEAEMKRLGVFRDIGAMASSIDEMITDLKAQ